MTENGTEYQADKVIKIVSIGVLRSNAITFNPPLPAKNITDIKAVSYTHLEPTRQAEISYAVFCLKKKNNN